MPPTWLTVIAWLSLIAAFGSALLIVADLRHRPQHMAVMNPVWPITALYFGPLGLWAYHAVGRSDRAKGRHRAHDRDGGQKSFAIGTFLGTTHCGAGCTLGDIIAEFIVLFSGIAIAGSVFGAELLLDFALAFAIGIAFQYFSIVPMRGLRPIEGIIAAVKADILSLAAFEVGLFGWMALMHYVFFTPRLSAASPVFWFMMQIGMLVGFATAYPMNWYLVRAGIKETM